MKTCCHKEKKIQANHVSLILSIHLSFSVLAQLTICLLSVSASLSGCLLSPVWARGAVVKQMSPLSQCYVGEIDSLASVLSAAICWCFHIPEKRGEGLIKTSKSQNYNPDYHCRGEAPSVKPWAPLPPQSLSPRKWRGLLEQHIKASFSLSHIF